MNSNMENECFNCSKQLTEDEIDLCDNCFETMPMNQWLIPNKTNNEREWNA